MKLQQSMFQKMYQFQMVGGEEDIPQKEHKKREALSDLSLIWGNTSPQLWFLYLSALTPGFIKLPQYQTFSEDLILDN